jgi:FAD dependent oxidoreductase
MSVAIIGGGIFGCCIAIELAKSNDHKVDILEEQEIMNSASRINHNRLHMGYHYLRSINTAEQCMEGLLSFLLYYSNCVKCEFPNYYAIAKAESKSTPEQFTAFCKKVGISFEQEFPAETYLERGLIAECFKVPEPVFDFSALKHKVLERLNAASDRIKVHTGTSCQKIVYTNKKYEITTNRGMPKMYDIVINASYVNYNVINKLIGIQPKQFRYEHVVIPKFSYHFSAFGLTVMDGDFCSIMPNGFQENKFLLYHVKESLSKSELTIFPPIIQTDHGCEARIYNLSSIFFPFLGGKSFEKLGSSEIVSIVGESEDDARITSIQTYQDHPNFYAVLSGKIVTCCKVALEIRHLIEGKDSTYKI